MQTLLTFLIIAAAFALVIAFMMIHALHAIIDEERQYRQDILERADLLIAEWARLKGGVDTVGPVEGRKRIDDLSRHKWARDPQRITKQLLEAGLRLKDDG